MSAPTVIAEPRTTNAAIFAMLPIVIDLLERRAIMRLSGNLASFRLIFRMSHAYVDDNSRGCWPYSVEKRFRPSSAVRYLEPKPDDRAAQHFDVDDSRHRSVNLRREPPLMSIDLELERINVD